jgi:hypothetical protein
MKKMVSAFVAVIVSIFFFINPAEAATGSTVGKSVHVGPWTMVFPAKVHGIPVHPHGDKNIFLFKHYFCFDVHVTNASHKTLPFRADLFSLTWRPKGGKIHYYPLDYAESYSVTKDAYRHHQWGFALPAVHQVKAGQSLNLILIFDIPNLISDGSIGTLGAFVDWNAQNQRYFEFGSIS